MNIAIVGAGALGRITALNLIAEQHQVSIYDRHPLDEPNNAAFASAGMLAPLGEIIHAPSKVMQMGQDSLKEWPSLLATLKKQDPEHADIYFQQNGSLAIAFPQDHSCFKQLQQDLTVKAKDYQHNIEWVGSDKLHELEPALERFESAAFLKNEAQLCNREFIQSSTRSLIKNANVMDATEVSDESFKSISKQYDWVIDCRGHGAINQNSPQLPESPLRGIRGEVLRVRSTEINLTRPVRVMHPRFQIYVVPKPNNEYVIGATEVESSSEHPVTLRSCLELMSTLYAMHPAFGEAEIVETRVGIRAAYADNTPIISQHENIISANGLYRHGWLVGPAVSRQIIERTQGDQHGLHH